MSTLAEGPRGLNHLLNHQGYQTHGRHHPVHPLSRHQHQPHQANSPVPSSAATPNANATRMAQEPETRQLRSSKRQQKAPDWGSFYKNGVPRQAEVIVIDDSPEPPAAPPHAPNGAANGPTHVMQQASATGSASKKRKHDDTSSQASYKNGQDVSGSSHKHSTTDSYQDRDTLPAPSANTSTDGSSIRGPKRRRVAKTKATSSVTLKRQDTKVLKSDHIEYRGLGRKAKKASPVAVRQIHVS
jgi:dual-specificity kinase